MKDLIHSTLTEKLTGFVYNAAESDQMANALAETLRNKLVGKRGFSFLYRMNLLQYMI